MNVLLIEPHDIMRQSIGMAATELFGEGSISAFSSVDRALKFELSPKRFDLAIIEPSEPDETHAFRKAMVAELQSFVGKKCRIVVLTMSFDRAEADAFLEMGVEKYLAKSGMDLVRLRFELANTSARLVEPDEAKVNRETYPAGLTRSEMLGHMALQGAYSFDEVCEVFSVEPDTLKRYARRAKNRI